jgi:hypothetical protein
MSTLTLKNLQGTYPANKITVPTGHTLYAPGGIVQVQSTTLTSTITSSGGQTWTDLTGVSVNITPTSASSKILVLFNASVSGSTNAGVYGTLLRLLRGSTAICLGDARGSGQQASCSIGHQYTNYAQSIMFNYLDSPSTTSTTTYKIQMFCETGTTGLLGGSYGTSYAYNSSTPTTITVMEIAQ